MIRRWLAIAVVALGDSRLFAQPAASPKILSIVNSASYTDYISAGAVVSLFGTNLAVGSFSASSVPLPTQLGQTRVMVGGVPAPLFFVSPNQINFQISWRYLQPGSPIVVVVNEGVASEPYSISAATNAGPGILTDDGSGCGQAAVLNVADDGSVSLNRASSSASPGQNITLFAVGLSAPYYPPPDGEPGGATWNPTGGVGASLIMGGKFLNQSYAGLAPGLVGVFQINSRLDVDSPEGCAVPIQLRIESEYSQIATISVHKGGGQCQPAVAYNIGSMEWRKTLATGIDPAPPPESFDAQFTNVALGGFYPANIAYEIFTMKSPQCDCYGAFSPKGPLCGFVDRSLDAGTLMLQTAGGTTYNLQRTPSGYEVSLPAGTIGAGSFSVSTLGGQDVGPFSSTLTLPLDPGLQVTTDLSPGSVFPVSTQGNHTRSFTVNWTAGQVGDTVHVQIISILDSRNGPNSGYCECVAPATQGTVSLMPVNVTPAPAFYPTGEVEVRVIVESEGAAIQNFTADGITQGIQHRWVYEWRFGKILFQ